MAVHSNIKICQINKITPDPTTIMGRKYPFAAEVYAAIRSNLDSKRNAFLLWRWLQTRIGQKVVEESGYIPIR
jgi:phosphate transport system substrate-binding protein